MTSADIFKHFSEQTEAFREYHIGYSQQSASWPQGEHPIDAIIERLSDLYVHLFLQHLVSVFIIVYCVDYARDICLQSGRSRGGRHGLWRGSSRA